MNNTDPKSPYWRRKLKAFMHDGPEKASDVKGHREKALLHSLFDQFEDGEQFDYRADHEASAADRLPFPHHSALKVSFDGVNETFRHPLGGSGGSALRLPLDSPIRSESLHEKASDTRVLLEKGDSRSQFLARWRFWRHWACDKDPAFAFLPADTRVPDHTIWHHLSLTTAFQGCLDLSRETEEAPALLLFSLGPVQPLIAAARSFRDLWSGSYLLSYLVATALKEIALELGPDHILFPSPWGQPLIDLMLQEVFEEAAVTDETRSLWESVSGKNSRARQAFLLPSLPNRFLSLVPGDQAEAWGQRLESVIRKKLLAIGQAVEKGIDVKHKNYPNYLPDRIEPQLQRTLDIHWQTLALPSTIEAAEEAGRKLLPSDPEDPSKPAEALASIQRLRKYWEALPKGVHTRYGMRNAATAWPILNALLAWLHDGVKQSRAFQSWLPPR